MPVVCVGHGEDEIEHGWVLAGAISILGPVRAKGTHRGILVIAFLLKDPATICKCIPNRSIELGDDRLEKCPRRV